MFKKKLVFVLLLSFTTFLSSCKNNNINVNPCNEEFINEEIKQMFSHIKRVDEDGYLYSLNYSYDYYKLKINDLFSYVNEFDSGCSAFSTYNASKEFLFCRNYDYRHEDKNKNITGLNIAILTSPKNKNKSISVCDGYWLNNETFFRGTLDDTKTDISQLAFAPYMCVDGLNDKGVSVALFAVDTKTGEKPINQNTGKEKISHSVLLRYILDNAQNVEEAIDIARSYDIFSLNNADIHMMINDQNGTTASLEWRQFVGDDQQKLYVTYTNAITNFFVGFDDGQDMYYPDGSLRENLVKVTGSKNTYHYGYGHGYHRFNGIISGIDRYIDDKNINKYGTKNAQMNEEQASFILAEAAQDAGVENTSLTQYSAIYNSKALNLILFSERDFSKFYTFSIV